MSDMKLPELPLADATCLQYALVRYTKDQMRAYAAEYGDLCHLKGREEEYAALVNVRNFDHWEEYEFGLDEAYDQSGREGEIAKKAFHAGELSTIKQSLAQPAQHNDDAAVDSFAAAMKIKLAKKREQGRSGWDDESRCEMSSLAEMLISQIAKGDPVDIANFCMMLHQREKMAIEHHPCHGGAAQRAVKEAAKTVTAWLHDDPERIDVCHDKAKNVWLKAWPQQVEHYTIALYRHPNPAPFIKAQRDEKVIFEGVHKHLDLTQDFDSWQQRKYKHSHVQCLWDGWQAAIASKNQP